MAEWPLQANGLLGGRAAEISDGNKNNLDNKVSSHAGMDGHVNIGD